MKQLSLTLILVITILVLSSPANASEPYTSDVTEIIVTLEDALKLAMENNPSIKNIDETINKSKVVTRMAWAILLPKLSAEGSVIRNDSEILMSLPDSSQVSNGGDPPMVDSVISEELGHNYSFTANTTLFNARSIPLLKNAYDNVELSLKQGRHQRNDLLFLVSTTYYQVHSAKELETVARQDLENAREFLRLNSALKQVGQATRLDVLRSESSLLEAEKNLSNAVDMVKLAKTALAYLTGIEGDYTISRPKAAEPVIGGFNELVEKALSDRLDLKAAETAYRIAKRDRIETLTKWIPNFDLTYVWEHTSAEGFAGKHDSWHVILGAKWAILDGGIKLAELAEDEINIRIARNNMRQLDLNVRETTERSLLEIDKRRRNIKLADKQVAFAEEGYRLVNKQYEVGLATSLDVLDAFTGLSKARVNRVLEELNYELAVLSLNKAVGEYHPLSGVDSQ